MTGYGHAALAWSLFFPTAFLVCDTPERAKKEKKEGCRPPHTYISLVLFLRLPVPLRSLRINKNIMEQQFYQPLSAALHAPLVQNNRSPQPHYASYQAHTQPSTSNGTHHSHREEEEEEEDEDDGADDDHDRSHRDQPSPGVLSSAHVNVHKTSG